MLIPVLHHRKLIKQRSQIWRFLRGRIHAHLLLKGKNLGRTVFITTGPVTGQEKNRSKPLSGPRERRTTTRVGPDRLPMPSPARAAAASLCGHCRPPLFTAAREAAALAGLSPAALARARGRGPCWPTGFAFPHPRPPARLRSGRARLFPPSRAWAGPPHTLACAGCREPDGPDFLPPHQHERPRPRRAGPDLLQHLRRRCCCSSSSSAAAAVADCVGRDGGRGRGCSPFPLSPFVRFNLFPPSPPSSLSGAREGEWAFSSSLRVTFIQ
jgi:hypothetical protein